MGDKLSGHIDHQRTTFQLERHQVNHIARSALCAKEKGLPEFGVMGIANGILTIYTTYV